MEKGDKGGKKKRGRKEVWREGNVRKNERKDGSRQINEIGQKEQLNDVEGRSMKKGREGNSVEE